MKQAAKTTLYLPEELHAEVKIEAAKRRISMTALFIQAIENELKSPKNSGIKVPTNTKTKIDE